MSGPFVAVSPDSHTATGDAAADAFIRTHGVENARRGTRSRALTLPKPPYTDASGFQQRARLLSDLGTIEHGRSFVGLVGEMQRMKIRLSVFTVTNWAEWIATL